MSTKTNINAKRSFLTEITTEFDFNKMEYEWIMQRLAKRLETVHFVDCVNGYDNYIILPTECSKNQKFEFYSNTTKRTRDIEVILDSMKKNTDVDLYVKFDTGKSLYLTTDNYIDVVENNPDAITEQYSSEANRLIQHVQSNFQKNVIQSKIDEALDQKNKELFELYTEQLINFK